MITQCTSILVALCVCLPRSSVAAVPHYVTPRPVLASGDLITATEITPPSIVIFTSAGKKKRSLSHPNWTSQGVPRLVRPDEHMHLWITNHGDHSIYEFGPSLEFLRAFDIANGQPGAIAGIAVKDGLLYVVSSQGTNSVRCFETERGRVLYDVPLQFEPRDVTVGKSPAGQPVLYVSQFSSVGVAQLDPMNGSILNSWTYGPGSTSNNLVLSSGRVLLEDYLGQQILELDPTQSGSAAFVTSPAPSLAPIPMPGFNLVGLEHRGGTLFVLNSSAASSLLEIDARSGAIVSSFPLGFAGGSTLAVVP